MRQHPSGSPWPSTDVRAVVETVAAVLSDRGHHLTDGFPAALTETEYQRHYDTIVDVDVELLSRKVEALLGRPVEDAELAPRNAQKRARARALGAPAYLESRYWLATWTYRLSSWWADYDVLMTPTMGDLPSVADASAIDTDASIVSRSVDMMAMTNFANIGGLPAISVPLGQTDSGIPIGIQFIGRQGAEDTLVALAADFEAGGPWFI
jgi:amidase